MEIEWKGVKCRTEDMREAVAMINFIVAGSKAKDEREEAGVVVETAISQAKEETKVARKHRLKHKSDAELLGVLRGVRRKMTLVAIVKRCGYAGLGTSVSRRILRLIADNNLKHVLKKRKNRFATIELDRDSQANVN